MGRVVKMKQQNVIINILLMVVIAYCFMLFDSSSETIIRLEGEASKKYIFYMYSSLITAVLATAAFLGKNFIK